MRKTQLLIFRCVDWSLDSNISRFDARIGRLIQILVASTRELVA
ncbi:hypothetical protein [Sporosarcina limicola]|uniref:Uncharacterized protein n=1 Tax=Sporosarcina limicola TaxID=34101 RepID=A0A927MH93_9BACL|nr:hypothetical protein [Sporosarcina limicola]MBE1554588.1 hypothetical protein [Sporosarcina limicola]